jgi:hypothetical protein
VPGASFFTAAATRRVASSTVPALTRRANPTYLRREPARTTLYQVVRDNVETFYAAVEEGFASPPLPEFVRGEFEDFLDCGILWRGAALLVCEDCPATKVSALSCKGRGFCPSCMGRRMAQTAANVVDHVLPQDVPLRQWVLTFPFELRARLGFDAELLSEVCGVVNAALLDFYDRALRDRGAGQGDSAKRRRKLQSGTITVVQRTSSDLRLNPHLHVVALDGVFAEEPEGSPSFIQLPELASIDVAEALTTIRSRVVRLLARRGVLETQTTGELELASHDAADSDQALAQLSSAAVTGQPPAGPERRERAPLRLAAAPGPSITGPLCATDSGFSLHAATVARRDDPAGKQALVRYVLRPPLAKDRLALLDDGLVRITLKRSFNDGTFAVDLDPLSLMSRLAASVPAPGFNTVRYGGVLAPAAHWRPLVIPPLPAADSDGHSDEPLGDAKPTARPPRRSGWRPWAELLKRSFDIDLRCSQCNGRMKLKSFLTSPKSLRRLLIRLDEPLEVQGKASARGPPYFDYGVACQSRQIGSQPPRR